MYQSTSQYRALKQNNQSIVKTTVKTIVSSLTPAVAIPVESIPIELATSPSRIQLSRQRGWRKPKNAVVVARPTKWGNPFVAVDGRTVEQAVDQYERWLRNHPTGIKTLNEAKAALRGKSLACWCKLGTPCHGDVLLKLVNS